MPETLDAVRPIRLVRVTGAGPEASRLWNGFVARWHYLGYTPLVGAQVRYAVEDLEGRPLAMLGFSAAAWRTAPPRRLHRMVAGGPGAEPPARDRQFQVPAHALGPDPEPGLAHPLRGAAPAAAGLARPLQGDAGPDGDLRRRPALNRGRVQGLRMDPCRHDTGTGQVRQEERMGEAQEGHLALPRSARTGSGRSTGEHRPQPCGQTPPAVARTRKPVTSTPSRRKTGQARIPIQHRGPRNSSGRRGKQAKGHEAGAGILGWHDQAKEQTRVQGSAGVRGKRGSAAVENSPPPHDRTFTIRSSPGTVPARH